MALLDDLNPQQRIAAETIDGPVLIFAGAGSGKTRTLTYRIAYMVQEHGIAPENILAVTFTNKAAGELKERIEALIGEKAYRLWAGTFHSMCARILRTDGAAIGIEPNFVIYDEADQRSLIKEALSINDIDSKQYSPVEIHYAISNAKNELVGVDQFRRTRKGPFDEIAHRVYRVYQQRLRDNNALDFDDLLMRTVELFEKRPEVLAKYQQRFLYVLVDEYQDINHAQYRFVQLLAQKHRNICVVGDDDQSIYGWRGANVGIILSFEQDWPGAKVIRLEQNYRSTQKILECAYEVIRHNKGRADKKLWTQNHPGDNIICYEAVNEEEEAEWVARLIREHVAAGAARYGDFAILYRTNAMSRAFEDALMNAHIPYEVVGGVRFYERSEIKDIIAYLRTIHNPGDSVSLRRIVNTPTRGIGERTLAVAERIAHRKSIPLYDAIALAAEDESLRPTSRQALAAFHDLIEALRRESEHRPLTEFVRSVVERSGLLEKLRQSASAEDAGRAENLEEFVTSARRFQEQSDDPSLGAFLEHIALISDIDEAQDLENSVSLMTLHSAKGLEFPIVIMVGLEEGIFPHERSMGDEFELEEERRLCYVGITRAQRLLYLTYAHRRTIYGETRRMQPSRFLSDLPAELVDWRTELSTMPQRLLAVTEDSFGQRVIGGRRIDLTELLSRVKSRKRAGKAEAENATPQVAASGRRADRRASGRRTEDLEQAASLPRFAVGERVVHDKFGEGVVVTTQGEGPDAELTVAFRGAGVKRLLARYAKLEKASG